MRWAQERRPHKKRKPGLVKEKFLCDPEKKEQSGQSFARGGKGSLETERGGSKKGHSQIVEKNRRWGSCPEKRKSFSWM